MAAEQETNINFVQEVEKHACLYNYNLPDYMRKNTIDKTWAEIGNKFQITGRFFCLYTNIVYYEMLRCILQTGLVLPRQ